MLPTMEAQAFPEPVSATSSRFINRELSWLDFNERVLALAVDQSRPLLERVKFVAIYTQNLDEFFQIRVSGLEEQVEAGVAAATPDGMTPTEQLEAIRERVTDLQARAASSFAGDLMPALEKERIRSVHWEQLSDADKGVPRPTVPGAHLPGADAAVGRPRAPVPLHLEPLAEPRGRDPRSAHR